MECFNVRFVHLMHVVSACGEAVPSVPFVLRKESCVSPLAIPVSHHHSHNGICDIASSLPQVQSIPYPHSYTSSEQPTMFLTTQYCGILGIPDVIPAVETTVDQYQVTLNQRQPEHSTSSLLDTSTTGCVNYRNSRNC